MQNNSDFNKLKSNRDKRNIQELMDKAHKENSRIIAWRDIGGEKITVDVFIRTVRKARNEIEIYSRDFSSDAYEKVLVGKGDVNLYIPELALLFQTKIYRMSGQDSAVVSYPKMIAQVERRKHLRLNLVGSPTEEVGCFFYKSINAKFLQTDIQTQYFEKNCHDISAGGLSLVLPKPAAKFFNEGELITQIFLALEGEELKTDGAVVAKVPIEPTKDNKLHYKGIKICLEFKNLKKEDQQKIEDFVFKNLRFDEAM
jgi:hypothetical protein